jgi:hypothetical protein
MRILSRRLLAVVVLVAATLGVVPLGVAGAPVVEAQTTDLGAGGEYHPLTPTRIFDSRVPSLDVAPKGKKPTSKAGSSFNIPVLGKGGIPSNANDVLAIVVGVTIADPESTGYMTVFAAGSNAGTSSLINFVQGRNVPNLAIVGVGTGGAVTARLTTGRGNFKAHVILDVFGWYSTTASGNRGARIIPTSPNRIFDSRTTGGALGKGQWRTVQVRGTSQVPNDTSVTGVMLNVTAVNNHPASLSTYVSITPQATTGGKPPSTSNVNVVPGQIKATMAIVPIGSDGKIRVYNHSGQNDVVLDVLAYLKTGATSASTAGRLIPLDAPFRVFDTRLPAFGGVPLAARSAENWSFEKFADSVTLNGAYVGEQSALIGNLTGTQLARLYPTVPASTFLTMYPGNLTKRPLASNLNVPENEDVPNMSLLKYGTVDANTADAIPPDDYVVTAYNHDGSLHYLLDVFAVVLK